MFIDPIYLLVVGIGAALSMWAQWRVKSNFAKYSQVAVRSRMTGAEAARAVCQAAGVHGVTIEEHQGFLSDHYDPRAKALRLSPDVYRGRSVASIAVAAHEAGHSIQDKTNYAMLGFRSQIVPATQIGARFWYLPFMAGVMLQMQGLMMLAAALFAGVVLFQFVTLPVEFDASRRAKAVLAQTGIVSTQEEARGVEKVLDAAAMTYMAAAAGALLQLLFILYRSGLLGGRSDD